MRNGLKCGRKVPSLQFIIIVQWNNRLDGVGTFNLLRAVIFLMFFLKTVTHYRLGDFPSCPKTLFSTPSLLVLLFVFKKSSWECGSLLITFFQNAYNCIYSSHMKIMFYVYSKVCFVLEELMPHYACLSLRCCKTLHCFSVHECVNTKVNTTLGKLELHLPSILRLNCNSTWSQFGSRGKALIFHPCKVYAF